MTAKRTLEQLFECLIHVIGRATIPESRVREVVGDGAKQIKAFNLADGTLAQSEIAKRTKIAQSNLSHTCKRWVEHGIAFWVGEGKEARLVHIYPIPSGGAKKPTRGKRQTSKGRRK